MSRKPKLTKLAYIHYVIFSALWEYDKVSAYRKASAAVDRLVKNKLVRGKRMEA